MSKHLVAVVIPVHNEKPTPYEEISIRQCFKVLGKHPIVFLSRKTLDTRNYEALGREAGVKVSFVKLDYRSGVYGYDELLVSSHFYRAVSRL